MASARAPAAIRKSISIADTGNCKYPKTQSETNEKPRRIPRIRGDSKTPKEPSQADHQNDSRKEIASERTLNLEKYQTTAREPSAVPDELTCGGSPLSFLIEPARAGRTPYRL